VAARGFQLEKWYLDVAAEDGALAIAYWTELRWRGLSLRAASLLVATPAGDVRQRSTLRAGGAPALEADGVRLRCPPLGLAGEWRGAAGGERLELWAGPPGAVHWQCLLPAAPASLSGPGFSISGTGYAERVTLTAPPWRLPLERLRWGRFAAPGGALTWIDWRGPHAVSLALHGRKRLALDAAGEGEISAAGGRVRLTLTEPTPLRGGALGAGPLRRLASILPRTFLSVDERKWRSRGRLAADGRTVDGWVIHEVVTWP
jgi:hypothetical protein